MAEINPEVLKVFGFWGSVLVLKVLAMAPLTARQRMGKGIFANQEDVNAKGKGKVAYNDPDVERVRRAHLNDLENILPWFIVTYIWLGTGPSTWLATLLIRTFVLSRIGHTLSYAVFPQQPMRAIAFFIGFGIMGYQAFQSLLYYC